MLIQEFDQFKVMNFDCNDAEPFFQLVNKNRSRLNDFFAGTVAKTKTLSDTQLYCDLIQQYIEGKSYFPFVIVDLHSTNFIGWIDVKNIAWNIPKAEIGYFIDHRFEGKKIISKALNYVLAYIETEYQFKKLLCRVGKDNLSSIQVALNSGFEYEGTIKADYKTTNNEIVDLNYYGKLY